MISVINSSIYRKCDAGMSGFSLKKYFAKAIFPANINYMIKVSQSNDIGHIGLEGLVLPLGQVTDQTFNHG